MNCTTSISNGSKISDSNIHSFKSNIKLCVNVDITTFSSSVLKIDQFIVNSILVISNKTIFVASVNNYGLMIFDMISKSVIDSICFNELIPSFPNEFIIIKLIQIQRNGMRILVENYGAFSIFWKGIGKFQVNEKVFIGMKLTDFIFSNLNEVSTTMIDIKENGFSQILYSGLNEFDIKDAYIHIYSFFNHANSKKFKEIRIGKVNSWVNIFQQPEYRRIITVWDDVIYMHYLNFNPSLLIYQINRGNTNLEILSQNSYGNKSINLVITNYTHKHVIPSWSICVIFVWIVIVLSIFFKFIWNKTFSSNYEYNTTESYKSTYRIRRCLVPL